MIKSLSDQIGSGAWRAVDSCTLGGLLAGRGDTEGMNCERAEAYLRLLAEEELRRPAWAWGKRRIRVGRVAQLLTAIGALDGEVAGRILAVFDLALLARQADARGLRVLAARSQRQSVAVRFGPAMQVSPGRRRPARYGAGWPGWGR